MVGVGVEDVVDEGVDVGVVVLAVVEAGDVVDVDVGGTLRSDRWCLVRCPRERRLRPYPPSIESDSSSVV